MIPQEIDCIDFAIGLIDEKHICSARKRAGGTVNLFTVMDIYKNCSTVMATVMATGMAVMAIMGVTIQKHTQIHVYANGKIYAWTTYNTGA